MTTQPESMTIDTALGYYSQWALTHQSARASRRSLRYLQPLQDRYPALPLTHLTADLLDALPATSHPERRMAAFTQFITFCHAQGWGPIPATDAILNPPVDEDVPEQWQRLLDAIPQDDQWDHHRDRLVYHLMYTVGLPLADIRQLTRWSLHSQQMRFNNEWVTLPPDVAEPVRAWLHCRQGYAPNPIFITPDADTDTLSVRTLRRRLQAYQRELDHPLSWTSLFMHGRYHGLVAGWALKSSRDGTPSREDKTGTVACADATLSDEALS